MKPSTDQVFQNVFNGFGFLVALRVALGDVDALDAGLLHQPRPAVAIMRGRLLELQAEIGGEVDQRRLTNHDTMPGLAPQVETAVRAAWVRRASPDSSVSRNA